MLRIVGAVALLLLSAPPVMAASFEGRNEAGHVPGTQCEGVTWGVTWPFLQFYEYRAQTHFFFVPTKTPSGVEEDKTGALFWRADCGVSAWLEDCLTRLDPIDCINNTPLPSREPGIH